MKEDQRKALDAGCNTFLAKPITGTRLVSALSDLMEPRGGSPGTDESGGHRVLLVEDDEDLADVTARILRQWGHEVSVAHRADTALEAALRLQPTLVLMDQNLPDQDGLTLRGALLDRLSRAPEIVALTGIQDVDALDRMDQAGFAAILIKPAKLDDLRQVLRDTALWEPGS
jgi:CheY-like chemotaxis protein